MAKEDFRYFHQLRVRWAEVDMQGIVFNGHYLTYFDVAFTEYWRLTKLPDPIEQAGTGFEMFARRSTIEYHAPARFDDLLDIYVRTAKLGRSSLQVLLEIYRQGPLAHDHLISGELLYVYADARARLSIAIPDAWRQRLIELEGRDLDS